MDRKILKNSFVSGIAILTATLAITVSPLAVYAQSANTTSSTNSAALANRMQELKNKAFKEIDRRLASLNEALTKIQNSTKLTSAQKQPIINSLTNEINGLQTLRTKIGQDSDITSLKTDVKSIIDLYRVYAVELPLARMMAAGDGIQEASSKISDVAQKINTLIQNAKNQGKDVTAITSLYNDLIAKLNDSNTQVTNALNVLASITPQGYPTNKTQLLTARDDIKNSFNDLRLARQDIRQIRIALREFRENKKSSVSSTSSSASNI